MSRVYETFVVLFLLSILVCGLAWVASALINNDESSRQTLFGKILFMVICGCRINSRLQPYLVSPSDFTFYDHNCLYFVCVAFSKF